MLEQFKNPFGSNSPAPVSAQSSGKIVNYTKIARDVGVSDQTVKTYFQILEDTLLGSFLPAFDQSVRKSQGKSPKFYLFDTGVVRALRRSISSPVVESTHEFSELFEHFVVGELKRRAEYEAADFQFTFVGAPNGKQIELIVDRSGKSKIAIEVKSTTSVREDDTTELRQLGGDMKGTELFVF